MNSNKYNRKIIDFIEEDIGFTTESKKTYGYCKIEIRGAKCRIKCCVNGLVNTDKESYEVNLVHINNSTKLIPVGKLKFDNNNLGSLNISTNTDKIANTNYSLDEVSAIVIKQIQSNSNTKIPLVAYIKEVDSSWKKNISYEEKEAKQFKSKANKEVIVDIDTSHEYTDKRDNNSNSNSIKEYTNINNEEEKAHSHISDENKPQEKVVEKVAEKIDEPKSQEEITETISKTDENELHREYGNTDTNNTTTNNNYKSVEIDDIGNQTLDIMRNQFDKEELKRIHINLFKDYPNIKPFEYECKDMQWIRIEPADIVYFPMDSWMLTNNTFLLNGYRKYKHLILGQDKYNFQDKPCFTLGVPGIYYPKNKVSAHFYGFKDFQCCAKTKNKVGEYGYWIKSVECYNSI